ncbi:hypothetical protein COV56_02180 [Candidatus Kuenenbacteria bacterium CG11_big_fil_rev_8_21_14_0_20_37_9]|uniref:DUF3566 domain-containing protein n=1 Tax=Candidatus Kuenenbacteria bacterium CG08_land_8_20_14_0_20_37_23 TaxID=1974617 RepID=A0A2M6XSX8_9BACT|nr:MAG: hypothetical protein COV56_02180 [Candidatus Kuenenbacteria bacterium CG11_big_fil_rev_8_21_14_0_20_37_9]PIU10679.1 MAG: hypothetical protein COT27_01980 [Candidatus Kuenenbacteria bacterium CG08_land_8_20_14_0_20_37_23]
MKYEIKKIDIWGMAKFAGIFYGLIGIIPMIFATAAFIGNRENLSPQFLAVLFFPLGASVLGFIVGLVFGFVYNSVAKEFGGIKLEIDYNQNVTDRA